MNHGQCEIEPVAPPSFGPDELDQFVRRTDELGGPSTAECAAYWSGLEYSPRTLLDRQLEPLSDGYIEQQFALYREITGQSYVESRDEFTPNVPVESLVDSPNAYGFMSPHEFAKHCVAMGLLVQKLALEKQARVLELGSGWGFCQEFMANCGLSTRGIDANPDFVRSSNARLSRLGFGERVSCMNFSEVNSSLGKYDVVLAYEAFHHAVDPLQLLRQVAGCVADGGRIALAAEPFNSFYNTWGLRLDPYSIYCIKKFGWFESGWSSDYMAYLFGCIGFVAEFEDLPISDLTRYMIARRSDLLNGTQLGLWHPDVARTVTRDGLGIFASADTVLIMPHACLGPPIVLEVENFSRSDLRVELAAGTETAEYSVPVGRSQLKINVAASGEHGNFLLRVQSETFCPKEQMINEDSRELGIRIVGARTHNFATPSIPAR